MKINCKGCGLVQQPRYTIEQTDILLINYKLNQYSDVLGEVYVGSQKMIIDELLQDVSKKVNLKFTHSFINGILCYGGNVSEFNLLSCYKHVINIIDNYIKPSVILFIGKEVEKYFKSEYPKGLKINDPQLHFDYGARKSPTWEPDVNKIAKLVQNELVEI